MGYVLAGGAAILGILVLYQLFQKTDTRKLVKALRWIVGGGLALLSVFLILRGQIGLVTLTAPLAFAILKFGKIGPIDFTTTEPSPDNRSSVRSHFIAMVLDHASGDVAGQVISGAFKGRDLMSLGEEETRRLLREVGGDPDSLSLLETWLDRNRAGWREWFAEQDSNTTQQSIDPDAEAYEILGLKPGATEDEIRAAHRALMMKVHPDQGGSTYLATKINAAKDRLLKKSMT